MPTVTLSVNGLTRSVAAWDPEMPLLYALRNDLGLHAAKFGCGLGQCGACTVLLDDAPARSCRVSVKDAAGHRIVTAEGLGSPDAPHPVQAASSPVPAALANAVFDATGARLRSVPFTSAKLKALLT